MTLLILAAGMGSRYGGLKQIDPIDDYGNCIIDYSVADAIEAGFDKVVFVIKREMLDVFKKTFGNRIASKVKVEYVFQELTDLPDGFNCPSTRIKPWGTAHAVLAARNVIDDSFIIINSDDYYGKESFKVAYKFLNDLPKDSKNVYANITFKAKNTMTENGSVKRGVCYTDENHLLTSMIESSIERNSNNEIVATPLFGAGDPFVINEDQDVSMNLFAFTNEIFDYLSNNFKDFLKAHMNDEKTEFMVPTEISNLVNKGIVKLKAIQTTSTWFGVTYKEDKPRVVKAIAELTAKGLYKKGLY